MDFAVRPTERDLRPTPQTPKRKRRPNGERESDESAPEKPEGAPREHDDGVGESLDLTA